MHFPFHLFSQHRFEVCIEYAILQLNFPARIILLFITHLLFITIFWKRNERWNRRWAKFPSKTRSPTNCRDEFAKSNSSLFSSWLIIKIEAR